MGEPAMVVFERMRALRAFEDQHLLFPKTDGNQHLIGEIGHYQAIGKPLTLKQLLLLGIGSVATIQRNLRRLRKLGLVQHRRVASDRRAVELTLTPKCVRLFAKYDTLMTLQRPARGSAEPRHVCGFCDSDAGRRDLLVGFLAQGLKRGDRCVLIAPAEGQYEILSELPQRRRASEQMTITDGHDSVAAQFAFFKREFREAKKAGRGISLAADMAWTFAKNVGIEAVLDIENRLDALAERSTLTGLCVYDARSFASRDFLQAVKCHRDHARHPIMLA